MRRRAVLVGTALMLATPRGVRGQSRVWRVGWLSAADSEYLATVREGLRDLGYVEGHNLVLVTRSAGANFAQLPEKARELVALNVDVIVTEGTEGVTAARMATSTVPIVSRVMADPVASGFAATLSRPGGNITGLSSADVGLSAKRLELLKEAIPRITRVGVLWNPPQPAHRGALQSLESAAQSFGIQLRPLAVATAAELDATLSRLRTERIDGLVVLGSALHLNQLQRTAAATLEQRVPAISFFVRFPDAGGLMAYGVDEHDMARRAASYVNRILKGAHPGQLPIEQATKFDLVINQRTARTLGVSIPQTLLLRATRVIE
jgi:putative ABC transport system substrate-binding protein